MKEPRNHSGVSLGRRELLASAGAAAAGLLMTHEAAGQANPAANVQDRGATIRISGFKAYSAS